ncbi:MAG: NAD(+) diphosphatase [Paracoccaceae bacterium]
MRLAELVTFGGTGLDRAAQLRANHEGLEHLIATSGECVLPVWRGKVPMIGDTADRLRFLAADHILFNDAPQAPVFLGREGEKGLFAREISAWPGPDADLSRVGAFIDDSEQHHPALGPRCRFVELRRIMARMSPRDAELAAMSVGVFSWHATHGHCASCGVRTDITQAGWQRRCPSCGRQHFPRTDPVVIMLVTNGNDLLIGRSPHWPEGMYSLLAGFMEPGETIEAAVRREVREETDIRVGEVSYLASQPWPFPSSLMIGCLAHAESREITIDETEIEDACWISREKLALDWGANEPTLMTARKGAIAHFLIRNWLADRLK